MSLLISRCLVVSKIALVKQQKVFTQQLQKMKKEQTLKLSSLKKGDLKRLRELNSLKGELTKKERVLGRWLCCGNIACCAISACACACAYAALNPLR